MCGRKNKNILFYVTEMAIHEYIMDNNVPQAVWQVCGWVRNPTEGVPSP
jgi:hypothetical protein